ncbi:MAG: flavodoxin [Deltaproteobacteria bacterium]|jgi:flavodoxin|nr:flavodoxin [Deltaproteobacteria bacterium]
MKQLMVFIIGLIFWVAPSLAFAQEKKILVIYFSWSGHTRGVAQLIHQKVGGDLVELQVIKPYPTGYDDCVKQAKSEQDNQVTPALLNPPKSLDQYDTVFLGFPNWWFSFPRPIATLLTSYDFSGKTIIPFVSHEGSRLGRSVEDIEKLAPKATVLEGLAVRGAGGSSLSQDIDAWLAKKIAIKKS